MSAFASGALRCRHWCGRLVRGESARHAALCTLGFVIGAVSCLVIGHALLTSEPAASPSPAPTTPGPQVVPNVVGLRVWRAVQRLTSVGLVTVIDDLPEPHATEAVGVGEPLTVAQNESPIVAQSPSAGSLTHVAFVHVTVAFPVGR